MMKSNAKRRLEKRLEAGLVIGSFLDSALVDAGAYVARLVLTEEDHDESCPVDRHKRIPVTRAEIYKREGDGYEMCVAASSAIDEYMQQNTLKTGWFSDAVRAAKKAARTVFHAGNDRKTQPQSGMSYDEMHGITEQEKRNYARYLRGEAPPPLRDEERRYRARQEGKFFVYDAVVAPQESSIKAVEMMANSTGKRGAHAMKMAYKAIHNASKRYGEEYAESLNQRFSSLYREGRFAEMIELAYTAV